MDGFLFITGLIVVFAVLGIAALGWGVDSRVDYADPGARDAGLSL
jgi:hypothetical protein